MMGSFRGLLLLLAAVHLLQLSPTQAKAFLPGQEKRPSGKRSYRLVFKGNENYSSWSLKKIIADELHDFETLGFRKTDIDDAAFTIARAYRKEGYPFASVDYALEEEKEVLVATFFIHEGARTFLEKVVLEGAQSFPEETLLRFFSGSASGLFGTGKVLFVRSEIESGAASLEDFYFNEGFLNVQVENPEIQISEDHTRARVKVRIQEGPRYSIREIRMGEEAAYREEILELARPFLDNPYTPYHRQNLQNRVHELLLEKGHLYGEVLVTPESGEPKERICLKVEVTPGSRYVIEVLRIEGNEKASSSFIEGRVGIHPGEIYSSKKVQKAHFNLFKTGLFSEISIQPEPAGKDSIVLVIRVKERESIEVIPFIGYGSYERVRGGISVTENNLFGTGRKGNITLKVSFKGEEARAGLVDPWLLGRSIQGNLTAFYHRREEPSFKWKEGGLKPGISKEILPHLSGSLTYGYTASKTYDVEADVEQTLIDSVRISSLTLQGRYERRNNFLEPTKGYFAEIQLEWAGDALGSDISFLRGEGALGYYLTPFWGVTLALSARTGVIRPMGDTEVIPLQKRFFSGGDTTVRSFKESELGPKDSFGDPFGGEAYSTFNGEMRIPIWNDLQGAIFYDTGNLLEKASQYSLRDMRSAVGFGFRYKLPIGPVRFDWGFNPNPREEEDSWNVFLSVGYPF